MKIDRYEILGEVGRGAVGRVLRARAPEGREVAIKVILSSRSSDVARFEREIRLQSTLGEEDGFVPVLDSGTRPETGPYVVMPLVPGGSLRDRLRRGPLGVEAARVLGVRLATALGRAHARGIVHRDLKPENVLFLSSALPSDGGSNMGDLERPLIADLGMAKHFDRRAPGASQSAELSFSGELRGTVTYMPPEQLADSKRVGAAADVYALGAVLYECLAGRPPYEGESMLQLLARIQTQPFVPLATRRPDVPLGLAQAIERALAHLPQERFANGRDMAIALEEGPVPTGRSRVLGVVLALFFMGAGLVAIFSLGSRPSSEPTSTTATAPSPAETVRSLVRDAQLAFVRGDDRGCQKLVARAAAIDTRDPGVLAVEGELAWLRDDMPEAVSFATRAIEHDPIASDALAAAIALTIQSLERNRALDPRAALTLADRALDLDPTNGLAFAARSFARGLLQDREGARVDVARARALYSPIDRQAWFHVAAARALGLEGPDALSELDRANAIAPNDAAILTYRSSVRWVANDRAGAMADVSRAIRLDPRFAYAWRTRAFFESQQAALEKAWADIDEAVKLDPSDPLALADRGEIRLRSGDWRGAIKDHEAALARAKVDGAVIEGIRKRLAELRAMGQ